MLRRIGVGPRLSDVAVFRDVAYFSGTVANDEDGDIVAQTRDVLSQIDQLLKEVGSDKTKILQCQIFLADLALFDGMNKAWDEWVPAGHTPPRATVEARLANPKWLVEIVLSAAIFRD